MPNETDTLSRAAMGWRCAACGGLISRIEDGWVEWLASEDDQGRTTLRGLRLVHQSAGNSGTPGHSCRYNEHDEFRNNQSVVEGLPLERFVGPDGLMLLFSLIAAAELPRDDVLELAKRVQVPGYEQAREWSLRAIAEGIVEPSIGTGYYLQSEIEALLRWVASQKHEPAA